MLVLLSGTRFWTCISFYKEVTARGGLNLVIKDGRWDEVASALNLRTDGPDPSFLLQQYYKDHLYDFEQMYFIRAQGGLNAPSMNPGTHVGKIFTGTIKTTFDGGYLITVTIGSETLRGFLFQAEKYACDQFAVDPGLIDGVYSGFDPDPVVKRVRASSTKKKTSQVFKKELGKENEPSAPQRIRNAYQIFYHEEHERLKKMHQGLDGKIRKTVIVASWKGLSKSERLPYVEKSRKDRERYEREMNAYKESLKKKINEDGYRPYVSEGNADDYYHLSLGTEVETSEFLSPGESIAQLADRLMESGAPELDPLQMDWDFSGSFPI